MELFGLDSLWFCTKETMPDDETTPWQIKTTHRAILTDDMQTAAMFIGANLPAIAANDWDEGLNSYFLAANKTEVWIIGHDYQWCQAIKEKAFKDSQRYSLNAFLFPVPIADRKSAKQIVTLCRAMQGKEADKRYANSDTPTKKLLNDLVADGDKDFTHGRKRFW